MRSCQKALAHPEPMPRSLRLIPLASLLAIQWVLVPTTQAQEPPTKTFEQKEASFADLQRMAPKR